MRYLGGKAKQAGEIASVIAEFRKPNQVYIEPFVGGAWVLERVPGERQAYDLNPLLIALYRAVQSGWIPPEIVTEQEYIEVKTGKPVPDYYKAFVGFGASFGGKWFGGYGRNACGRNYAGEAGRSLLRLAPKLQGVTFTVANYLDLNPKQTVVYCDPPYDGATPYDYCPSFDSSQFWETMRKWARDNTVIISEYAAPKDFVCIWEQETFVSVNLHRNPNRARDLRVERLFTLES